MARLRHSMAWQGRQAKSCLPGVWPHYFLTGKAQVALVAFTAVTAMQRCGWQRQTAPVSSWPCQSCLANSNHVRHLLWPSIQLSPARAVPHLVLH